MGEKLLLMDLDKNETYGLACDIIHSSASPDPGPGRGRTAGLRVAAVRAGGGMAATPQAEGGHGV